MENIKNSNMVEVPIFIYNWLNKEYKNWNFRSEKDKGEFVFRVIQDLIKYHNKEETWGDFELTNDVSTWVKNNEFDFIKAIIDGCYPTLKEPKYYWRLKGMTNSERIYFNQYENNWFVSLKEQMCGFKTQFTEKEFKQICEEKGIMFEAFEKEEI